MADPFTPLAAAASWICNSGLLIMNAGLSGPSGGGSRGLPRGDQRQQGQQQGPFRQGKSTFHSGGNTSVSGC